MKRWLTGIRAKLIAIFILIKVLPLLALAWFAAQAIAQLGRTVEERAAASIADTRLVVAQVGNRSTENSIAALDLRSREAIERLTTDTARAVADFLQGRDQDILQAAALPPDPHAYREFLALRARSTVEHGPWVLNPEGSGWIPGEERPAGPVVTADVDDNRKDFHSRPPEISPRTVRRPLYLEMTFLGPDGRERVKVTTSDLLPRDLRDVSRRENTWCRAETYFAALKGLRPGEIYVSEVVGPYVGSPLIGPYTPARAEKSGIPYAPEEAAYAGQENPVGRRFAGLVRWAAPVVREGRLEGYVTLALDHRHVMDFTDLVLPTEERYTSISDAASGNYAFMWDHEGRCISHPRDYFITGYDPATGDPAVPWLDSEIHDLWRASGKSYAEFQPDAPRFASPSLERRPAPDLTRQGLLGLDCRYLNFAPQCSGWRNLTQHGGSGSFVIFWSGLWKLTTAAAIPYHTGMYSGPRGFGFVTVGANVDEFHRAATETARELDAMVADFERDLDRKKEATLATLAAELGRTTRDLVLSTLAMVAAVVLIAIWMASALTGRITAMIRGIRAFQHGDADARLQVRSRDEMGELATAFNEMCGSVLDALNSARDAEARYRDIFDNAVEGIYQSAPSGRFLRANPALAGLLGYPSPQALVEAITDISTQVYADPAAREEYLRLLKTHGEVNGFEAEFKRRDGTTFWGQLNSRAVHDEAGKILFTEGLIQDVTARRLSRQALEQARDEAEAASQMKTHFLSMVSHELRTPLTSVAGFVKLVRKKLETVLFPRLDRSDPAVEKAVRQIGENLGIVIGEGDRLSSLVNDVLDLTRLEAGKMEWSMGPVDLGEVLALAAATMRVQAQDKGLGLDVRVVPGLPLVQGDADRLRQVALNLLSNAIKFTEAGGILCAAEADGKRVVVSVSDTGPGIEPEYHQEMFEKFWQRGDVLTDKPRGTGLGLAICREIVAHHGGRIWIESTPGQGATFRFTLPLPDAA
ncbi:MAG: ATP-binding protein [Thermodesulfobacteriota bacterium]